jgi:hypothetical protein
MITQGTGVFFPSGRKNHAFKISPEQVKERSFFMKRNSKSVKVFSFFLAKNIVRVGLSTGKWMVFISFLLNSY